MVYLCILSVILSLLSLLIRTYDENVSTFLIVIATVCIVIICNIFDEPQRIKEKCVELGIGKFVVDKKANVKFYFINHKNEMIEYNQLIEYSENQENK